ncbi:hypothetical protein RN001_011051 [Aquatica leii]|uniref:Uncharacterized protein n=1 Tax=Aquatica leii TaxID=1421715 RepID=A0AAN7P1U4_9COLE|nr:hypothetical protein RN001_011051 [Aquatica leii]
MLQFKLLNFLPKIDLSITLNPIACNRIPTVLTTCATTVSTCSGPSTSDIVSSPGCLVYGPDKELLSYLEREDMTIKPPNKKKNFDIYKWTGSIA